MAFGQHRAFDQLPTPCAAFHPHHAQQAGLAEDGFDRAQLVELQLALQATCHQLHRTGFKHPTLQPVVDVQLHAQGLAWHQAQR